MTDDHMDMAPKMLPACYVCGRRMKTGVIAGVLENKVITDRAAMPDDYRPVVWRYRHEDCSGDREELATALPKVYVAWIRLTIRLIDQRSAQYLFDITNWRYILDCVQADYIEGLNEYENPPLRGQKKVVDKDPETKYPDGRKPVLRRKVLTPTPKLPPLKRKIVRR